MSRNLPFVRLRSSTKSLFPAPIENGVPAHFLAHPRTDHGLGMGLGYGVEPDGHHVVKGNAGEPVVVGIGVTDCDELGLGLGENLPGHHVVRVNGGEGDGDAVSAAEIVSIAARLLSDPFSDPSCFLTHENCSAAITQMTINRYIEPPP